LRENNQVKPIVRKTVKQKGENTIALINVVFLMLIFFLVAGTLTTPPDRDVTLISLKNSDRSPPPDMLFVRLDGSLSWRGEPTDLLTVIANWQKANQGEAVPMRLAADKELPALKLLEVVKELKSNGAERIVLVTEREGS